jgi:regulator of sigma E protease
VMGLVGFPRNAVIIGTVAANSPAAQAGLQPGDHVLTLSGKTITNTNQFSALVQAHRGQTLPLTVLRNGQQVVLSVTPQVIQGYNGGKASLGVGLGEVLYSTTTVSLVQPKSRGMQQGLKIGDQVTQINGKPVDNGWDVYTALSGVDADLNPVDASGNLLTAGAGTPITLTVRRGSETLQLTFPGDTTFVTLGLQFKPVLEHLPLGASIQRSLSEAYNMLVGIAYSMRFVFTRVGMQSVTGPVGIAQIIAQSSQSDWYTFLQMVVMISTLIGLFNLFPLPALDGGRIFFVALAGVGIHVSARREALVHAVGMILLLCLVGLVTFTDVLAMF